MAWRGPTTSKITNQAPNNVSHGNEMSGMNKPIPHAGVPFKENRALDVRRDKDKGKDFSVNLIDIDGAILNYLDTVINPTIIDAGRSVKVPINYASPERWKAIRQDGAIRDKHGKMQCPAIAFRRTTMERNDGLITLNRYLQYPVVKSFSEKNKYDRFSAMTGFSPVKELYSVAMPDHVIINYDFIVWTDLVEQNNKVVESINFSTEDYWGDKARFKFRTSIRDFNFETVVDAGQDRAVKTTFSLTVYAYLLPDRYENYKSVVEKAFTTRKVVINFDAVVTNASYATSTSQSLEGYSVGPPSPARTIGATMETAGYYTRLPSIIQAADYAFNTSYAESAGTSSYFNASGSVSLGGMTLISNGATGSFGTHAEFSVSTTTEVDVVPLTTGNAAKWLVSILDASATNLKTSEVVAAWNNTVFSFYVTEVSEIGTVPVSLSVNNSGGNINLVATPLSGTWNIKMVRTVV